MRRLAIMNPDALITEIESLRTRNAELHRELQAAEAEIEEAHIVYIVANSDGCYSKTNSDGWSRYPHEGDTHEARLIRIKPIKEN